MAGWLRFSAFQHWFRIENRSFIKAVMVILTLEMGLQKLTLNGFGVFFDPKVPFAPVHTGR